MRERLNPDTAMYNGNDVNRMILQTFTTNVSTGLNDLFVSDYTESLCRADFYRNFAHHTWLMDNQSGYVFVMDFSDYNVFQPPFPSIQGTYEWDIQDSRGNYLVRGLVETAQNDGGF